MEEIENRFRSAISQLEDSNLGSALLSSFDKAKASVNSSSPWSSSEAIPTEMPPPMVIRSPGYLLLHQISLLFLLTIFSILICASSFVSWLIINWSNFTRISKFLVLLLSSLQQVTQYPCRIWDFRLCNDLMFWVFVICKSYNSSIPN